VASNFTVIYDACILYSNPLRSLLMDLALTDLYRARWSEEIHQEWMRNVRKNRPDIPEEKLLRTKTLMDSNVRDYLVTGYESLIPGLFLPDENDRHVLAAAIRCQASVIVTFNLKDFPNQQLSPYEIEAQHPDEFISNLIDLYPVPVFRAVERDRQRLKNPPLDSEQYLEILFSLSLTNTSSMLRNFYFQG
jgi:predicted nucleic acid-binding protein